MNTWRARSVRAVLLWWLIPAMIVALIASAVLSYRSILQFCNAAYDNSLHETAMLLSERIVVDINSMKLDLPPEIDRVLLADTVDRVYFRVVTPDNRAFAGEPNLPDAPGNVSTKLPTYYDGEFNGERVRLAALRVGQTPASRPAIVIVAETLKKRERLTKRLIAAVVLPQLALLLLGIGLIWLAVGRGLAPLNAMATTLSRRGWNDLRSVDESAVPIETRPLAHSINGLMQRLASALSAQQRFIADAAHQLRTPIAGLLAQTERALEEKDPQKRQASLEYLLISGRRVVRLVNQLLTLAKAEPGADPGSRFESLDLATVARDTCAQWVPQALSAGVDLGYEGPQSNVPLKGDPVLLGEMLSNLIDNAIRYGRPQGTITVSLRAHDRIELSVIDDGNGLSDLEMTSLFQRFRRLPDSPGSGSGLGLAIVKEIAQAHAAEVSVGRDKDSGGNRFTISFEPQSEQRASAIVATGS